MAADLCACPDLSCNIATANRLPRCLQVKFNNGKKRKKKKQAHPHVGKEPEAGIYWCLSFCLPVGSIAPLPVPDCLLPSSLTFKTVICFCIFYILLSAFFSSHPVAPGHQLEAVEGPPDFPGLHRDENPTGGSPVQPQEKMVGKPKRRPPLERFGSGAAFAETTADIIRMERVN